MVIMTDKKKDNIKMFINISEDVVKNEIEKIISLDTDYILSLDISFYKTLNINALSNSLFMNRVEVKEAYKRIYQNMIYRLHDHVTNYVYNKLNQNDYYRFNVTINTIFMIVTGHIICEQYKHHAYNSFKELYESIFKK